MTDYARDTKEQLLRRVIELTDADAIRWKIAPDLGKPTEAVKLAEFVGLRFSLTISSSDMSMFLGEIGTEEILVIHSDFDLDQLLASVSQQSVRIDNELSQRYLDVLNDAQNPRAHDR